MEGRKIHRVYVRSAPRRGDGAGDVTERSPGVTRVGPVVYAPPSLPIESFATFANFARFGPFPFGKPFKPRTGASASLEPSPAKPS